MNKSRVVLRWAVAVVLGAGAIRLLAEPPPPLHAAIGLAELAGAALLLASRTRRVGAYVLLAVLACAAVVHALAGEVPPLAFVVYAAALVVAMERT
ncbi:MAG: hypothetical protein ACM31C_33770 [Acidobacteriota bacterium]